MKMQVVMAARNIPAGSDVTKVNGSKNYILRKSINVYDELGNKQVIEATGDCWFIVDTQNGNTTTVTGESKLMWHTEDWELLDFLESNLQSH